MLSIMDKPVCSCSHQYNHPFRLIISDLNDKLFLIVKFINIINSSYGQKLSCLNS